MSKVTKKREKLNGQKWFGANSSRWAWDVDVYHVVADTYSELIVAIDQITDNDLFWHTGHQGEMGFEGLPHKSKGKWRAKLRTKKIGKGWERA